MLLRSVVAEDLDAYIRMRCDPRMMVDLGGPRKPADIKRKVLRDAAQAAADAEWILMICPDDDPAEVAGTVTLWAHIEAGEQQTQIGWMVLPEFQGVGLAKRAVSEVLARAASDGRWGPIHAFPSVTNTASNRLCEALGFSSLGEHDFSFAGRTFRVEYWVFQPAA
jgi:RimJ/RimL family protein N-acetyltransferase